MIAELVHWKSLASSLIGLSIGLIYPYKWTPYERRVLGLEVKNSGGPDQPSAAGAGDWLLRRSCVVREAHLGYVICGFWTYLSMIPALILTRKSIARFGVDMMWMELSIPGDRSRHRSQKHPPKNLRF